MGNNRRYFGVAVIAVALVAFGSGVVLQWRFRILPSDSGVVSGQDVFSRDDFAPAPSFYEWMYPGARLLGNGKGAHIYVHRQLIREPRKYAVFVSPDHIHQVEKFFLQKGEFESVSRKDPVAVDISSTLESETARVVDVLGGTGPGANRRAHVVCLCRRTRTFDLTVFITRCENESHTRVVVLYLAKTDADVEFR